MNNNNPNNNSIWWLNAPGKTLVLSHPPMTVGSRSTYRALGTWRPELPLLKKVLKGSWRELPCGGTSRATPSGPMPCSRQKSSQQEFPVCTPAWPTWMEMHSLYIHTHTGKPACTHNYLNHICIVEISIQICKYFIHLIHTQKNNKLDNPSKMDTFGIVKV